MRFPPTLRNGRKGRIELSTQNTLMLSRKGSESNYGLELLIAMGQD